MSLTEIDSRVNILEQGRAVHEQRLNVLDGTVLALAALPTQYATLHITLNSVIDDVKELKTILEQRDAKVAKTQERDRTERRNLRYALIGLSAAVLAPTVELVIRSLGG